MQKPRLSRRKYKDIAHLPVDEYDRIAKQRRDKEYRPKAPPRDAASISAKNRRLHLRKYGLTLEQYDELLSKQGGHCAICPAVDDLVVDHCHEAGHVRGLLCRKCNVMLGMSEDDADRLERAAAYLRGCS